MLGVYGIIDSNGIRLSVNTSVVEVLTLTPGENRPITTADVQTSGKGNDAFKCFMQNK